MVFYTYLGTDFKYRLIANFRSWRIFASAVGRILLPELAHFHFRCWRFHN